MDKSIPYVSVRMIKRDADVYPRYALPEGYAFRFYERGMERDWARQLARVGETADEAQGLRIFERDFRPAEAILPQRLLFVAAPGGEIVGTAMLFPGELGGVPTAQVHWVSVAPEHEGKGVAKAMLTKLFDMYREYGLSGPVFLGTQTWSYRAVGLYRRFGFAPWEGEARFDGWAIIDEMLERSQKARGCACNQTFT